MKYLQIFTPIHDEKGVNKYVSEELNGCSKELNLKKIYLMRTVRKLKSPRETGSVFVEQARP